jgi:hypothetical protein
METLGCENNVSLQPDHAVWTQPGGSVFREYPGIKSFFEASGNGRETAG